eukprot:TRINITY_DN9432_c0_g1_i2.p1 TRINITY_DN9432_c0_g1~~TRINITY_DN9432_c0_g1_i2.p1  ORF type:complete len:122 (-),score=22.95 TRINITY_DN9432_c0_g1_i2:81-446(-)
MGSTRIIRMLHNAGASINHQDYHFGFTPLMQACAFGYMHSARYFINNGADLDVQDFDYLETALHLAVHFEYPDVAQLLIKNGADLMIRNIDNMTALEVAVDLEDKEMEQILRHAEVFYLEN